MILTKDDPRHGTINAYNHHRCRCEKCVTAHRTKMAQQKALRLERGLDPDDPRHGTDNAYCNWDCRCDPCRRAHSEMLRIRRYTRPSKKEWTIHDIIPEDLKVTQEIA